MKIVKRIEKALEDPDQLRRDLQRSGSSEMRLRRAVIGMSLIGIGCMGAVTLLQTGVVKHLPVRSFDSDQVNSSKTAYRYALQTGVQDGTPCGPVGTARESWRDRKNSPEITVLYWHDPPKIFCELIS